MVPLGTQQRNPLRFGALFHARKERPELVHWLNLLGQAVQDISSWHHQARRAVRHGGSQ